MLNGKIYSVSNNSINIHKAKGDNDLTEQEVCLFEGDLNFTLTNHQRNTIVFSFRATGSSEYMEYEFNGENALSLIDSHPNLIAYNGSGSYTRLLKAKDYIYSYDTSNITEIHQLNLATYESNVIPIMGSEIYNIQSSLLSNELTFSGLEYSTGNNVVGVIHENGKVTTMMTLEEKEKIINLIPVN